MILRPPVVKRTDTLFPYTTLFRSHAARRSAWLLQGGIAGEAAIPRLKPANIVHIGLALFIARAGQTAALQSRFYFLTLEGAACRGESPRREIGRAHV